MRVFLTDISAIDKKELKRLAATLPPFRKASAERCNEDNYPQHVVSFCLVRYAIKQLDANADTEHWSIGEHGKPRLAAGKPFFNLSHSATIVAVVVSEESEIGIDIEEIRPHPKGFAARYFGADEQAAVEAAVDPTAELCRIWSAKEAVGKALGTGLSGGICAIPCNRAQSIRIEVSNRPHWLSVAPANTMPPLEWISADRLV